MNDSLEYLQALQASGISNAVDTVKQESQDAIGNITQPITDLLLAGSLKSVVSNTVPMISNLAKGLATKATEAVTKAVNPTEVAGPVETAEGIEMSAMDSNIGIGAIAEGEAVVAQSTGFLSGLSSVVNTVASGVNQLASGVATSLAGTQVGNYADMVAQASAKVANVAESAEQTVVSGVGSGTQWLESAVSSVGNTAIEAAQGALGNVGGLALGAVNNLQSGVSAAAESVAPALSNIAATATNIATGAEQAVTDVTNTVAGAVSSATAAATDATTAAATTAATAGEAVAATTGEAIAAGTDALATAGAGLSATGVLAPIGALIGVIGAIVSGLESAGDLTSSYQSVLNPSAQFL